MAISPDGHCHCHCMRGKVAQGLSRLRGGGTRPVRSAGFQGTGPYVRPHTSNYMGPVSRA